MVLPENDPKRTRRCTCLRKCHGGTFVTPQTYSNHRKYREADGAQVQGELSLLRGEQPASVATHMDTDSDDGMGGGGASGGPPEDDRLAQRPGPLQDEFLDLQPPQDSEPPAGVDNPPPAPRRDSPQSSRSSSRETSRSSSPSPGAPNPDFGSWDEPEREEDDELEDEDDDDDEFDTNAHRDGAEVDYDSLPTAKLPKLLLAQQMISAIRSATLEDDLGYGASQSLQNPSSDPPELDAKTRLSFQIFDALLGSSKETYAKVKFILETNDPPLELLSYHETKQALTSLTNIRPIKTDMCPKSCLAFTGPFADHEHCMRCGSPRYHATKRKKGQPVARKQFPTLPLGPQLQTLWRHPESARHMRFLEEKTASVSDALVRSNGVLSEYEDFYHSSDYLDLVRAGRVRPNYMPTRRMAEMLSQQLQSFSNSGGPPPPSANTYVHARRVTEAEHEHILRKTLPLAFDSTVPFVVDYNPEIHGNIDHWEEGSWSKKGESSSSGQLAAKLQFLQQLSGAEMEASKLKKAYNTVGSIFSTIKSVDSRILRPTWVDIHKTDKPFAHAVYKQIYAEYPEFSLCKDHWKIRKFLIGWYKPWYDKHVAPELGVVIKQEPPGEHKILGKRALPTGSTQDASKAKRKKALFPGPVNPTSLVTPPEAATSLVAPPVPESLSKPPQESETEAVSPSKTPTDAPPTAETPKNDALEPNTEAQVTSSPSRSASPLPPPKSPPTAAAQSGTTEPVPPAAKSFDDDIETPPPPPPRKEVALEGGTVKKRRGGKTKGSDSKGGGASARKRAGTKEAESKPATTTKMYYRQHWRTSNPDKRLAEFEEDWVKLSEAEKQEWATKFRNRNKA
ncbi:hypothetical protein AX16_005183 [Volvariella volvacea WC 439]|nr:hypothetical protein AX16_005183 [Volvariella volvacea WC 439]